jgi:5-methylcytosine-specific restriction endonuclease McrA
MSPLRCCIICARIIPSGNRCELHRKPPVSRHRQYRKLRERLIAEHPYCHICRKPFTDPDDPPVLDHVVPRAHGGTDDETNLRPAHRSCYGRKGATIGSWFEPPPPGGGGCIA